MKLKQLIIPIVAGLMCVTMTFGCMGCGGTTGGETVNGGGNSNQGTSESASAIAALQRELAELKSKSSQTQSQLSQTQSQLSQTQSELSQTQSELREEIDALQARILLLEGQVENPKNCYKIGEKMTYVNNGFELFDFTVLDAWKENNSKTKVTCEFHHTKDLIGVGQLSQYLKIYIDDPDGSGRSYSSEWADLSFSFEKKLTLSFSINSFGIAFLNLALFSGGSYNTLAKFQLDLQLRV